MTAKISGLTLAVALTAGAIPALAGGDVIYQGYKDPSAAIPVPAPIPVETYEPEYYVRFDVGASWMADGDIAEYGSPLDVRSADELETIEFGSIGAGRYITPSIRVEVAVDLHNKAEVSESNVSYYTATRGFRGPDVTVGLNTVPTFDTSSYDVERRESVKFEQDLGMINAYYDFNNSTRFTPYIGAGLGVTYRQLTRSATEVANCTQTTNSDPVNVPYPAGFCVNTTDLPATYTVTYEDKQNRWDIAAAAMAGFSYNITDDIILDTGYRYLWQNGGMSLTSPTVSGTSRIEVKDITQHQFRTGLRLNLN